MKTYFMTVHNSLHDKGHDFGFEVRANDMYEIAGLVAAMTAGARMTLGKDGGSFSLTDLSTSKRRGVEYVNLDVWAQ